MSQEVSYIVLSDGEDDDDDSCQVIDATKEPADCDVQRLSQTVSKSLSLERVASTRKGRVKREPAAVAAGKLDSDESSTASAAPDASAKRLKVETSATARQEQRCLAKEAKDATNELLKRQKAAVKKPVSVRTTKKLQQETRDAEDAEQFSDLPGFDLAAANAAKKAASSKSKKVVEPAVAPIGDMDVPHSTRVALASAQPHARLQQQHAASLGGIQPILCTDLLTSGAVRSVTVFELDDEEESEPVYVRQTIFAYGSLFATCRVSVEQIGSLLDLKADPVQLLICLGTASHDAQPLYQISHRLVSLAGPELLDAFNTLLNCAAKGRAATFTLTFHTHCYQMVLTTGCMLGSVDFVCHAYVERRKLPIAGGGAVLNDGNAQLRAILAHALGLAQHHKLRHVAVLLDQLVLLGADVQLETLDKDLRELLGTLPKGQLETFRVLVTKADTGLAGELKFFYTDYQKKLEARRKLEAEAAEKERVRRATEAEKERLRLLEVAEKGREEREFRRNLEQIREMEEKEMDKNQLNSSTLVDDYELKTVNISPARPLEFDGVIARFRQTLPGVRIVKLEKVSNPYQEVMYTNTKKMVVTKSGSASGVETLLFHGTDPAKLHSILKSGFNRSYCGVNGTAFGQGVYFARDAAYSHNYAARGFTVTRKTVYLMMYCRVLTGVFAQCVNAQAKDAGMRPDGKHDNDALVDNINNPSIYVIFRDYRALPQYIIHYTV